jgi:hypothetical protein
VGRKRSRRMNGGHFLPRYTYLRLNLAARIPFPQFPTVQMISLSLNLSSKHTPQTLRIFTFSPPPALETLLSHAICSGEEILKTHSEDVLSSMCVQGLKLGEKGDFHRLSSTFAYFVLQGRRMTIACLATYVPMRLPAY